LSADDKITVIIQEGKCMVSTEEILDANILIVDDQEANVQLLEQMLSEAGYRNVSSTTDSQAVCTLHRTNRYDLILLDLQMPVMDGFQVMEGLKEIDTEDYVPILVITAQPGHKLRALASGAKDFVSKPLDLIEVKTRIHNMLEVRLLYKQLEKHKQALEHTVEVRTAELRESEMRFRRLTELSSDWYWEQDENGQFTKIFGMVQEMLGIQFDGAQLKTKDEHAGYLKESERKILEEKLAARQPFQDYVYSRINPDGSRQYLMVSGEPILDSSGRYKGYRGVGREITKTLLYS
jgi:PAS domain S-box-containing protein